MSTCSLCRDTLKVFKRLLVITQGGWGYQRSQVSDERFQQELKNQMRDFNKPKEELKNQMTDFNKLKEDWRRRVRTRVHASPRGETEVILYKRELSFVDSSRGYSV